MSLRKRLSFKRVWNFHTVGNAHQIQPKKKGLVVLLTARNGARHNCWSESTWAHSKGIHDMCPDNEMGHVRQMGMNEEEERERKGPEQAVPPNVVIKAAPAGTQGSVRHL